MEKKIAILRAEEHLKHENLKEPFGKDYKFILENDPKEYSEYWYFDYSYTKLQKVEGESLESFGGAPGFVVEKISGDIQTVSWGWLSEIKLYEKALKAIMNVLNEGYKSQSSGQEIAEILSLEQEEYFNLKKEIRKAMVKKIDIKSFIEDCVINLLEKKYIEIRRLKRIKKDR